MLSVIVTKFSEFNYFPSTFVPLLCLHQRMCVLQNYNTAVYLYWCKFSKISSSKIIFIKNLKNRTRPHP